MIKLTVAQIKEIAVTAGEGTPGCKTIVTIESMTAPEIAGDSYHAQYTGTYILEGHSV